MNHETVFSLDRVYRYTLWRDWRDWFNNNDPFVTFICLNPSTADETKDDPTIRRCIGFSKQWGYSQFCMLNLFGFRTPLPQVLRRQKFPIGEHNDLWIQKVTERADMVIAAWGNNGEFMKRADAVRQLITRPLHALRVTRIGMPEHPLYLPENLKPVLYEHRIVPQTVPTSPGHRPVCPRCNNSVGTPKVEGSNEGGDSVSDPGR